jgi:hypothetical protein
LLKNPIVGGVPSIAKIIEKKVKLWNQALLAEKKDERLAGNPLGLDIAR